MVSSPLRDRTALTTRRDRGFYLDVRTDDERVPGTCAPAAELRVVDARRSRSIAAPPRTPPRMTEVCGDDATPLGAGVVVVTGARGSGKTTLVNRLVSAFLHDAPSRAARRAPRATETETLTRATPRSAAAARTADERARTSTPTCVALPRAAARSPRWRRSARASSLTPTTPNVVVRRAAGRPPRRARHRHLPRRARDPRARGQGPDRGPTDSPGAPALEPDLLPPRRGGNPHDRPRDHLDSDAEGGLRRTPRVPPLDPPSPPPSSRRLATRLGRRATSPPAPGRTARTLSADPNRPVIAASDRPRLDPRDHRPSPRSRRRRASRPSRRPSTRVPDVRAPRMHRGDVLVELPLDLDVVIVDTPGAPTFRTVSPRGSSTMTSPARRPTNGPFLRQRLGSSRRSRTDGHPPGRLRRTPRSFRALARR